MIMNCRECGTAFESAGARGRPPRFCGATCRKRFSRHKGIPSSMRERSQWVRAIGKRPIMPNGAPASSTDPSTWGSWKSVVSGAGDGFGIMLGRGLGCYDLDGCIEDGRISDFARSTIAGIAEPIIFIERSMSGRGLHIFVEAEESPGRRLDGVERYARGRFIRMTADIVEVSA